MMNDIIRLQKFTSTQEQYNHSNYNPNSTIGLVDSSATFVPTVKVGETFYNTGKVVTPYVVRQTGQVYDDVTLGIISQGNKVAPNLTNKYLVNNVKVNESLIDATTDYFLLGIPSPSKIGYGVGGYGLLTDFLERNKDK
ncbi:hypothetical protein [Arcobacter sp. FWKO B]|uniref:hypothetical protein n=1 Tax=Arcobacter sp. FWKO B TaxID=2593672 RepID=UPI0018A3ECAF|nr:hypothetical protein [Arcobacter sp. FWKO B]QOG12451.1 hypothetical protein FWKOB_06940 [Arcobacter sp. FWKO B]